MLGQGTGPVKKIEAILSSCRSSLLAAAFTLIVANLSATATLAQSAGATAPNPTAIVQSLIAQATAVLQDPGVPASIRQRKLRAIAEADFDFAEMARSALGYHWRTLTPDQQRQFVPLFTAFIEDVYLSKLEEYSVKRVRQDIHGANIAFTGQTIASPGYVEVHSTVSLANHPSPVRVDYMLVGHGADWKIYDIQVDSISVIANYRSQFTRVINEHGYQALIDALRQKTQQLGGSMGS